MNSSNCQFNVHFIMLLIKVITLNQQKMKIIHPENQNFLQKKQTTKSYIFIIFSCIFWVCGYIYGNEHKFTPIQTNLSRSIVMTVVIYIVCRKMNLNIEYKSKKAWYTLLKRHLIFILQGFALAEMQFIVPLGITHTLSATGPVSTFLLQVYLFKTTLLNKAKLLGCILSFLGIVLISNGRYLNSYFNDSFQFSTKFENYLTDSYFIVIIAIFLFILTNMAWAYAVLITQQAQCHAFQIVFHFAVTNLLVSSISYMFLPQKRPMGQIYYSLIWVGFFLTLAQICFTLALNLSQNMANTTILGFSCVIIGHGVSILRYHQPFEIISVLGTIIIIVGVSIVILAKEARSNCENNIQVKD